MPEETAHPPHASAAIAPTETRTISWSDPRVLSAQLGRLPGIDLLRAVIDGRLPPPPMAQLMNIVLREVSRGRAVFGAVPGVCHYNPLGSVHGGFSATLL